MEEETDKIVFPDTCLVLKNIGKRRVVGSSGKRKKISAVSLIVS